MTSPSLALQKLLRARLVVSAELTALVAANSILDRGGRPELFPCVLVGTGFEIPGDYWRDTYFDQVFADLHIWTQESDTVAAKEIAHEIRKALRGYPWPAPGFSCHELEIERMTFLRDPDGLHAHGVVSVRAILQERAAA